MVKWAERLVHVANQQNLRGQNLLFKCMETGFVTTAPALARYQTGRGIDPSRRVLVGPKPADWTKTRPYLVCDRCGAKIHGGPWDMAQHKKSKRCLRYGLDS